MENGSPALRNLARRLLAVEASQPGGDPLVPVPVRACEKLRVSLTRFAGADGFVALLRRALALARAEFPALQAVALKPDCFTLDGLETLAPDGAEGGPEAAAAIFSHLLGLLITFIGASLTLRLVGEAWPDALREE